MVRVASFDNFGVYVYAESGEPHHLPHCNVRWPDHDAQLTLPTLDHLVGDPVPRKVRAQMAEIVDDICAKWDELNPTLPVNGEEMQ